MISKLAAGIYTWMPLGLRVLRKVEHIVREEMNRAGAIELLMPVVQPAELWQESGRWDKYGPELLRIKDRHQRDFVLGPTHEEVITDIARKDLKSYRQLPVNLYQIQTKFRDEIRPRFGVMRAREFIMKDAYSFDVDRRRAADEYRNMYDAYARIFTRLGLQFRAVRGRHRRDRRHARRTSSRCWPTRARTRSPGRPDSDYAANVEAGRGASRRARPARPPASRCRKCRRRAVDLRGRRRAARSAAGAHGEVHHAARPTAGCTCSCCAAITRSTRSRPASCRGLARISLGDRSGDRRATGCEPGYLGPVGSRPTCRSSPIARSP